MNLLNVTARFEQNVLDFEIRLFNFALDDDNQITCDTRERWRSRECHVIYREREIGENLRGEMYLKSGRLVHDQREGRRVHGVRESPILDARRGT